MTNSLMSRAFPPVAASILALTACAWAVPLSAKTALYARLAPRPLPSVQQA